MKASQGIDRTVFDGPLGPKSALRIEQMHRRRRYPRRIALAGERQPLLGSDHRPWLLQMRSEAPTHRDAPDGTAEDVAPSDGDRSGNARPIRTSAVTHACHSVLPTD